MPLFAYNLTGAPVTLAGTSPPVVLAPSTSPPNPGPQKSVGGELRGFSPAEFAALEAQRPGTVLYLWSMLPEFDTGSLVAQSGGGAALPVQDGHAGEFLRTDGNFPEWIPVPAIPDQAGHSGEVLKTTGASLFWGVAAGGGGVVEYDDYASFPDPSTAAGSFAWDRQTDQLYVSAENAWEPVKTLNPVFDTITLKDLGNDSVNYYVNASTGNDNNDGSFATPFATLQKAIDTIPDYWENRDYTIWVYGSFTDSVGTNLRGKKAINGTILIRGDALSTVETLNGGNPCAEATDGYSGHKTITDPSGPGWTPDEHVGRFLAPLFGGSPAPIITNTADTLTVASAGFFGGGTIVAPVTVFHDPNGAGGLLIQDCEASITLSRIAWTTDIPGSSQSIVRNCTSVLFSQCTVPHPVFSGSAVYANISTFYAPYPLSSDLAFSDDDQISLTNVVLANLLFYAGNSAISLFSVGLLNATIAETPQLTANRLNVHGTGLSNSGFKNWSITRGAFNDITGVSFSGSGTSSSTLTICGSNVPAATYAITASGKHQVFVSSSANMTGTLGDIKVGDLGAISWAEFTVRGNIHDANGSGGRVAADDSLDLVRLRNVSTFNLPASAETGSLLHHTDDNVPSVWDGSNWVHVLVDSSTPPNWNGNHTFNNPVNVATPTLGGHASTKGYVDSVAAGLSPKQAVKVLSNANVVLSGLPTIDSVATVENDRVLLIAQDDPKENGIWTAKLLGWIRTQDFSSGSEASGAFAFVDQGSSYKETGWVCSTDKGSDIIDTNDLAFVKFAQIVTPVTFAEVNAALATADADIDINGQQITSAGFIVFRNDQDAWLFPDDSTDPDAPGREITIAGGAATNGDANGGSAYLQGGPGIGTGKGGDAYLNGGTQLDGGGGAGGGDVYIDGGSTNDPTNYGKIYVGTVNTERVTIGTGNPVPGESAPFSKVMLNGALNQVALVFAHGAGGYGYHAITVSPTNDPTVPAEPISFIGAFGTPGTPGLPSSAGSSAYMQGGQGGALGAGTLAGGGGHAYVLGGTPGTGGAAAGGSANVWGRSGSDGTAIEIPGPGGSVTIYTGHGGATDVDSTGLMPNGGDLYFQVGNGSNASNNSPAGNGGTMYWSGGNGGAGTATQPAGSPGLFRFFPGSPGTNNGGGPGYAQDFGILPSPGGVADATHAATPGGGFYHYNTGTGGAGSAAFSGGPGGTVGLYTGVGGADNGMGGGVGGLLGIYTGAGAASASATQAGMGGGFQLLAGEGGAGSNVAGGAGGVGGYLTFTAGAGGAGTADVIAGLGGNVEISAGDAGLDGGFGGNNGGDVILSGGAATGSGTPGIVSVQSNMNLNSNLFSGAIIDGDLLFEKAENHSVTIDTPVDMTGIGLGKSIQIIGHAGPPVSATYSRAGHVTVRGGWGAAGDGSYVGGASGVVQILGGTGGTDGGTGPGASGTVDLYGGWGASATTGVFAGAAGGYVGVYGGTGGDSAGGAGGGGADVYIGGGWAGTGVAPADGGGVFIDSGGGTTGGISGVIEIGAATATNITIGNVASTTTIDGKSLWFGWTVTGVQSGPGEYTASAAWETVRVDPTGGAVRVYLPTAVGLGGKQIKVKNVTSDLTNITVYSGTRSTGSIDCVLLGLNDNDPLIIDDGVNPAVEFRYHVGGGYVPGAWTEIDVTLAGSDDDVATATANAMNGAGLEIAATAALANVALLHNIPGTAVEVAIATFPGVFTVSGMSGGADENIDLVNNFVMNTSGECNTFESDNTNWMWVS